MRPPGWALWCCPELQPNLWAVLCDASLVAAAKIGGLDALSPRTFHIFNFSSYVQVISSMDALKQLHGDVSDLIGLPSASTIASRYNTCATSFSRLSQLCSKSDYSFSDQVAPSAVQDEFGRFRVWAGNIGAHRTGRVSLDYRLREASHMYQRVTDLLDELNATLKEGMYNICDPTLKTARVYAKHRE